MLVKKVYLRGAEHNKGGFHRGGVKADWGGERVSFLDYFFELTRLIFEMGSSKEEKG